MIFPQSVWQQTYGLVSMLPFDAKYQTGVRPNDLSAYSRETFLLDIDIQSKEHLDMNLPEGTSCEMYIYYKSTEEVLISLLEMLINRLYCTLQITSRVRFESSEFDHR